VEIKPTPLEFLVNALSSNVSTHYTLEVFNPGDAVPVADNRDNIVPMGTPNVAAISL
jgi:hypothetical protein